MIKNYLFLTSLLLSFPALAEIFYPSNMLQLDDKFSHHVMLVEKSSHKISVYKNTNGIPELVKTYKIATGKFAGNKTNEGDKKTPEGIYQLWDFYSKDKLHKMYNANDAKIFGAGAFPTNYPNIIDSRNGKTGSGIWLHSTDDESRIDKGLDSKGCVVVVDSDLKEIAQYIDLDNTSIVIVHDLFFLNEKKWSDQRKEINELITGWRNAWREENVDAYMEFYHPQEFKDAKGTFQTYKAYKKAVFSNPGKPMVDFFNISILSFNDYIVVQMEQKYVSNTINDSGKKTLYLKKNHNYEWKIVAELWAKIPEDKGSNFVPANRFFKE
ncbi:MAG: L,D-transpeptidase family protein [Bacteriovoracaceae bacterium]